MNKYLYLLAFIPFYISASHASEPVKYVCDRFKSNCKGEACHRVYAAFAKDISRSIMSVRKTEKVLYEITPQKAIEKIQGIKLTASKGRQFVISYNHVIYAYGVINLSNNDRKKETKEHADIKVGNGLYRYYQIHRDGSIKDVPVGEPYRAYFGWCEDISTPGASLPDSTPVEEKIEEKKPEPANNIENTDIK